jgi:meiotically up-regulated gene 157 (Mug157) protein
MAVIMRALTSDDDDEIAACLATLKAAAAGTGLMHESFNKDNAGSYTRPWFAWANSLFGELILQLHKERPHLLRRTPQ